MPYLISTQISCNSNTNILRHDRKDWFMLLSCSQIYFNVGTMRPLRWWWCCIKCDHQIDETWLNVDMGNCRAEETWNMPSVMCLDSLTNQRAGIPSLGQSEARQCLWGLQSCFLEILRLIPDKTEKVWRECEFKYLFTHYGWNWRI